MLNRRNALLVLVVAGLLAAVALLAACGSDGEEAEAGSTSQAKDSGELFTIRYPTLLFSDPVYIADELGFFEEQGIKVEFTGSAEDVVTPVATGDNDFAGTHAPWITAAIAKGFPVKAVAAGWASTSEVPSFAFLVRDDDTIKTPKDLKGKKVAAGARDYIFLELLSQNGLTEDDIEKVTLPFDKMEQALRNKQVDAIGLLPPFLTKALKTGGLRQLASAPDILGDEVGWPQQFVNTDFAEEHPDIVKGFVAAIAEACDWARANPEEAGKIFAKRFGAPEEWAEYYTAAYPEHALVNEENAQLWLDIVIKYGDVKEGQITTSDIYTNEYNPYYQK